MAKKKHVRKPNPDTINRHVERLRKLAAKHDGVLPNYSWLNKHGFFGSYDIVRQFTKNFAGIRRAFAKRNGATAPTRKRRVARRPAPAPAPAEAIGAGT